MTSLHRRSRAQPFRCRRADPRRKDRTRRCRHARRHAAVRQTGRGHPRLRRKHSRRLHPAQRSGRRDSERLQLGRRESPIHTSRTLLRNVRVLAVDQKADETKGQLVVVGKTATLEVSPAEAEIISSAQAAGTLSLALRSIADLDEKPTRGPRRAASTCAFSEPERAKMSKSGAKARSFNDAMTPRALWTG